MQYSINLDFVLFITLPNLFVLFELKESTQKNIAQRESNVWLVSWCSG